MSKRKIALDFSFYPPRWIKDQDIIEEKKDRDDFIVNPSISAKLKKAKPYRWKLENGQIEVMSEEEAEKKLKKISLKQDKVADQKRKEEEKRRKKAEGKYKLFIFLSLAISLFLLGLRIYENQEYLLELLQTLKQQWSTHVTLFN